MNGSTSPDAHTHPEPLPAVGEKPPYRWGLAAGALVFVLYAVTLAPTTQFWDTSEYIATARILGIPHPPGNPLFVVLARAWEVLLSPLGLSTATEINLFSATMSAAAHGLWFMVAYEILGRFRESHRFRVVGAFAAVIVSATAFTVWNQSNVNEKVYTVSLFTIVLLTWLAFRWRVRAGEDRNDNLLVLMAFILALSVGNHLMAFLAAPAILVYVLLIRPRSLLDYRLYVAGIAAVVVGLSIHMFLPLRAELDPIINEADPTCESVGGAVTSILTWGQTGCEELSAALAREQYLKPPLLPRQAPLLAQFGNYLQYFDWQWSRSLDGSDYLFPLARLPFTLGFALLGLLGALEHYRRDRASWAYVAVLFGTLSAALVFYLNFEYGYSFPVQAGDSDPTTEVRERDYFFIVSFSVWGVWAGIGIAALWRGLSDRLGGSLARGAPVLGIALLPLVLNWSWADRSDDYSARDWAYNLLMSVEPYAVLFTNGDNDTFPLWYLQEVEGIRKDVTVIVTSYLNTEWYVRQIRGLTSPCETGEDPSDDPTRIICQRPYDPAGTGAEYAREGAGTGDRVHLVTRRPVTRPERAVLTLDDSTILEVSQSYLPIETDQAFQIGDLVARLPGNQYLMPWQQFALAAVNQSIGERPIYFASSGNAAQSLGLADYLVREGLAFRVHETELDPASPPPGFVYMGDASISTVTGAWVNVPRTASLFQDVFVHRGGIPDAWDHWPDHSTVGIPHYYAWGRYALAQAALLEGDTTALDLNSQIAERWMELGN